MTTAISKIVSIDSNLDRRGSSSSPIPIRNRRVNSPPTFGRLKSFEQRDISETFEGTDEMKVTFSSSNVPLDNRGESVRLNSESEKTPMIIRKAAAPASARGMPLSKPVIENASLQNESSSPICSVPAGTPLKSSTPTFHNISMTTITSPCISTPPSLKVATTPSSGSAKRIAAAPVSVRSTNKPPPLKIDIAPLRRGSRDSCHFDSSPTAYHGDSTESTPRFSWPGGSPQARAGSPPLAILGSSSKSKMLAMNGRDCSKFTETSLGISEGSTQQISSSVLSNSDINGSNKRPVDSSVRPGLIASQKKDALISSLWNLSSDFSLSGSVTSDSEFSDKNKTGGSENSEITLSPRRESKLGSIQEPSDDVRSITTTAVAPNRIDLNDLTLSIGHAKDPIDYSSNEILPNHMMNSARSEDPPRRRRSTRNVNRSSSLPTMRR